MTHLTHQNGPLFLRWRPAGRRQCVWALAVLVALSACRAESKPGTEAGQAPATGGAGNDLTATTPAAPTLVAPDGFPAEMLRFGDLPEEARRVLAVEVPDFVPWRLEDYPASERTTSAKGPDAGLVVVRGHFRDTSTVDFAIAGHDQHRSRIVALLGAPNGRFIVSEVEGPSRDALGAGVPWSPSPVAPPAHRLYVSAERPWLLTVFYLQSGAQAESGKRYVSSLSYLWDSELRRWVTNEPND